MELFFRSFVLVALLTLSGVACAVGMGGINVSSALGEPLNAEIELAGIGKKANIGGSLTARIASPDVFKGAGLEFPYTLPTLKFEIESRPDGEPYLRITSQSPVNDPFVTLLVELNWPSGRLLREYTFLLDPPGFMPEQPAESKVKPLAPVAAATTQVPSVEAVNIQSGRAGAGTPAASTAATINMPVSVGRTSTGKIIVKRGDTLHKIARQTGPPNVSLERMLVALYRANADEFDGHNMNRIRVGQILRIPSESVIDNVTQADAMDEIRIQAADWDTYRRKLAAASLTSKEPTSRQEVSGKIGAKMAENTQSAKESVKEVVRLSKGEMSGDNAATGNMSKSLQGRLAGLQEELIAKDIRLKDNSNRIALLEKNIKEMQHLIELKSQTMASAKVAETKPQAPAGAAAGTAAAPSPAPAPVPAGAAREAPQVRPAAPPQPVAAPTEVPPAPSMMDEFLGNPLYVAGFAVVLLALGGGLILVRRNKRRNQGWGSLEKSIAEPVVHAAAPGEITPSSPIISAAVPEEEIDPVSEAELFLNFGRDAQAEEILKDALEKDPNNRQILLKLLSIYLKRKDAKTFFAVAQQVRDSGDAGAWAQVAEMGRKLEPNNPMYGGESEGEQATEEVVSPELVRKEQTSQGLDFDLDFGGEKSPTGLTAVLEIDKPAESAALDFDLGDAMTGIGGEGKAAGAKDKTAQLFPDSGQTVQAEMQRDFIDLNSQSMSLPVGKVEAGKPATAGEEAPAEDEVIDITSKSMSMSLPVGQVEIGKPVAAGEETPAEDEVIDITSKSMSMSLPVGDVEIGRHAAGGEETAAEDEVIDITSESLSTSFPVGKVETGMHGIGGEAPPAVEDFIDISSESLPRQRVDQDKSITGGVVAPSPIDASAFEGIDLNLTEPASEEGTGSEVSGERWTEVATKIDLAKAYQEMGDAAGAHEILTEVMDEGNDQQRATAKSMLEQLTS